MREDIYAARIAVARDAIAASLVELDGVKGFEDVPGLMAGTSHREPEITVLLEREAYASVIERLVNAFITRSKGKQGQLVAELQTKVDELTAANTALLADIEAFKELAKSDSPSASDVGGTDAAKP